MTGTNSWWSYLDNGSDQGAAWFATGFNHSAWLAGPAAMGYGEPATRQNTTNISFGPDPNNKYITTYFRHAVTVTNASAITNLVARFQRDDGVAIYLNGVEVARNNVPAGAGFNTPAINSDANDGTVFYSTNLNTSLLTNGINVVAAEVHQDVVTSSDITWYLELTGSGANGNTSPTVSLTGPAEGATFKPGTNITISANAADTDGTITNVAFYAGATKLGDDATAPFAFTWTNVAQGVYSLTAVASDNGGATATTTPGVNITVNDFVIVPVSLIPTGAVWKYFDQGADQGTAWKEFAFNDGGWSNGVAELGYGDTADGRPEATIVSFGADAANKYPTTYFRRAFVATNIAAITNLTIRLMRDDGAVVWINGTEIRRDNLALAPAVITYASNALVSVGGTDEFAFFATTNTASLNNGTNIIAVEVHQNVGTSSDISFDLELIANTVQGLAFTNSGAPFVQSQSPVAGATVSSLTSAQVTFSESVTGVDAADFLVNGVAATGVSGSGATRTFTFAQPANGTVNITWAVGHGIVDQDLSPLPRRVSRRGLLDYPFSVVSSEN